MRYLYSICVLFFSLSIFGQLSGVFDYRVYPTEENERYAEFYYSFSTKNLKPEYISADSNQIQYKVEVTLFLKDSVNAILNYDKAIFKSPIYSTPNISEFSFVNRIKLNNAAENIEVNFKDPSDTILQNIDIKPSNEMMGFNKSEYISKPLIIVATDSSALISKGGKKFNINHEKVFFNEESKIEFYTETKVLNSGDNKNYAIRFTITNKGNKAVLQRIVKFTETAEPFVSIASFPLSGLAPGLYNLNALLYGNSMEILDSSSTSFEVLEKSPSLAESVDINNLITNNSFISNVNNFDSLNLLIGSLGPISEDFESVKINNRKNSFSNVEDQKIFFYNFWEKRNPEKPDLAWSNYYEKVKLVNATYGTPIKEGYETDRGRVYLKYGEPNTISQRPNEPDSYPYEIWHYYKISTFNNIRFVFFSQDEVTNDYQLLHSDMPQELRNPQWQVVLRNRSNRNPDLLNTDPGNSFGGRSDDLFNNPR